MKNPAKAGFFLLIKILCKPLCKRPSALASVPELVRPDNFCLYLPVSQGKPAVCAPHNAMVLGT
ncbi:hypothetical protein PS710_00896 [Pseudomonas fluorescens]|uniref:Uncharacterized protein n=1 Tax=Pseudomonas fluorescens TaxID=294 RepID=A0A5E7AIA6_PSEFL|nr:hypothetical protein PS710_00896 [Pseudomonas fluorescens]